MAKTGLGFMKVLQVFLTTLNSGLFYLCISMRGVYGGGEDEV